MRMKRGDLVGVVWWDIQTDPTGNSDYAKPRVCRTPGYFEGWKVFEESGIRRRFLVISVTKDVVGEKEELARQEGWWCIPQGCVISVKSLAGKKR